MCLVNRGNLFSSLPYVVNVLSKMYLFRIYKLHWIFSHEIASAVVCTLKWFPRLSCVLVALFFYPHAKPPVKANPCWWDSPCWWSIFWNILNFYCKHQIFVYLNEESKGFKALKVRILPIASLCLGWHFELYILKAVRRYINMNFT